MSAFTLQRERLYLLLTLAALGGLVLSACQPLSLHVSEVNQTGERLKVSAADCSYGGEIQSIEALDGQTVQFTLCESDPAFLSKVASPVFSIQDRAVLNETQGDSDLLSAAPNASGPYQLVSLSADALTLRPNPYYWGTPARIQTLVIKWSLSDVQAMNQLGIGEINAINNLNPVYLVRYINNQRYNLFYRPSTNVGYLGMNNQIAPFDDVRVRQGISMLLDRQQLLNDAYPSGSGLADQFLSATFSPGHTLALPWLDYNLQAGVDLLKQAGFDFTREYNLYYDPESTEYFPMPTRVAEDIRDQLAESGIQVKLFPVVKEKFSAEINQGLYELFLNGWVADYPDANAFYQTVFVNNAQQFGEPYVEIQNAASIAAHQPETTARKSAYDDLNTLVRDMTPAIPLAYGGEVALFQNKITGVQIGPLAENFSQIISPDETLIFVQKNPPTSLWPADEKDTDTLRIARLLYTTLVSYANDSIEIQPALAESWEVNADDTVFVFHLRPDAHFLNGKLIDANDVVASFSAIWNSADPNHRGNSGEFQVFKEFFGDFMSQGQ
ncbi:MAG TPA: ABC transporter substrate-binding protein [Bellilinea sp.]|nr:ABC transporter substrate-binding protein [Bellilinea sp.]